MDANESLFYAFGQIAYAIAKSDGKVQNEERQKFHDLTVNELGKHRFSFNISDIIFQIIDKEKMDTETAYEWAMNQFRLNSHYLSPELKLTFLRTLEKIERAYPPATTEEKEILQRFRKDIKLIEGDPVYYNQ